MLVINCGEYIKARNHVNSLQESLTTPGQMILTPKQWSQLGADYAEAEFDGGGSDWQEHVFCNIDHFLNGIRVAIKKENLADPEIQQRFVVHFFNGKTEDPIVLHIDRNGKLNRWPEGFFDQIEEDLSQL